MSNSLITTGYNVTTTAAQYGIDGKKSYMLLENLGAVVLKFGFGATEPSVFHTLAVGGIFEWNNVIPSGKIWLEAASDTCAVALTV